MAINNLESLIAQIDLALAEENYEHASRLLIDDVDHLLEQGEASLVPTLLTRFPAYLCDQNPRLLYVQALLYARSAQASEAGKLLERAYHTFVVTQHDYDQAVLCCLELARIYQAQEQFHLVYTYLLERAKMWIDADVVQRPTIRARFFLRMAEIAPDLGKLDESLLYARRALAAFRQIDDITGQFHALARIVSTQIEQGDFVETESALRQAKTALMVGELGARCEARYLNLELHFHWSQGNLALAVERGLAFKRFAERQGFAIYTVFANVLLGNFYRAQGDFANADVYYQRTRQLANDANYHNYFVWIDAQSAWLRCLQGEKDEARTLIYNSLKSADLGQAMSFQVILAVLELSDGHVQNAERLLRESLEFYTRSGDLLACCALHGYLAICAQRQNNTVDHHTHLRHCFGFLARQRLDYFPHWWHPSYVSELCAATLVAGLYADVAERIFVQRLADSAISTLRQLATAESPDLQRRAQRILRLLNNGEPAALADLPDSIAKQTLLTLVKAELLDGDGLAQLRHDLTTAEKRHTPNPTLLAVFGLYIHGENRAQIADKLACSMALVRNYINLIYQTAGLGTTGGESRLARRKRLSKVAREKGWLR